MISVVYWPSIPGPKIVFYERLQVMPNERRSYQAELCYDLSIELLKNLPTSMAMRIVK